MSPVPQTAETKRFYRKLANYVGWAIFFDTTNITEAISAFRMTDMATVESDPYNAEDHINRLVQEIVERDLSFQSWTAMRLSTVKVASIHIPLGPWYLLFTNSDDAIMARMLIDV